MSTTLHKTLNLGLAALLIASVGATATTQSVSARHVRTHRVYRHRRRSHRRLTRVRRNRRHRVNYRKHNRIRRRNRRIRARKSKRSLRRRTNRRHLKIRRIRRRNVRIRGRKTRRHAKRAQKRFTKKVTKTEPETTTQPVQSATAQPATQASPQLASVQPIQSSEPTLVQTAPQTATRPTTQTPATQQSASSNQPQMSASDQTDQIVPMQTSSEINHQTKLFDYFAVQDINHDREQAGLPALQPSSKLNYYANKLIYPDMAGGKYAFQGPYDFANSGNNLYIDEWGISKKLPNWGQNSENVIATEPNSDHYGNNGKSAADIYENDERNEQLSSYQDSNHEHNDNIPSNVTNPHFGHIGFAGLYVPDQGYDGVALFSK